MKLLLFDIDGTLVNASGGGEAAVQAAVTSVTGQDPDTENVAFAGRTDPNIFRDVLRTNNLPTEEGLLAKVIDAYVSEARSTLKEDNVTRLSGAAALLSAVEKRDDMHLGLVTGNVEAVAYHKLTMAGLDHHFSVGAFGSDHPERGRLPDLAVRRAREQTGHSHSIENALIIGDTKHDIACAHQSGARSMAVATGRSSRSDLAPFAPDLLFDGLNDPAHILQRILTLFAENSVTSESRHDL